MRLRVGTSGFGYAEWRGKFYPRGLRPDEMLAYYAERFDAVEINSSFYRVPAEAPLRAWAAVTPPEFTFSFKAPAEITHLRRLQGAGPPLRRFLSAIAAVGDKLGCVVFQLPPGFKKDLERLESFLALLPSGGRFAFEFRHPSWFSDDVLAALRRRGAALCLNDADVAGCPLSATAPFGALKLRRERYTDRELAARLREVRSQPWSEAFVFFKHEARATGPKLAARLLALARAGSSPAPGAARRAARWPRAAASRPPAARRAPAAQAAKASGRAGTGAPRSHRAPAR